MNGFIFINNDGEYAVEASALTHGGTSRYVRWSKDINAATVFSSRSPWAGMMNKHLLELKTAQPLQATVTRTVKLEIWLKD